MVGKKIPEPLIVMSAGIFFILFFTLHQEAWATSSSGIVEPLYSHPYVNGSFYWQPLVDAKLAHPDVPFFAIVNPDDGPGLPQPTCATFTSASGNLTRDFQNGIGNLTKDGIIVLGYVDTINDASGLQKKYGAVKGEIDTWKGCFPQVQGIFLDDMETWPFSYGNLTYYQNLTDYIHNGVSMRYSFGNPGTDTDPRFVKTVDVMNIFERGSLPAGQDLIGLNNWRLNYDKDHFMFVAFNQTRLPDAASIRENSLYAKFLFVTNGSMPNPWKTIPAYLNQELADLDAPSIDVQINSVNQGAFLAGVPVQISQPVNRTSTMVRTEDTPFDFNTTSGLVYKITAQPCYGTWKFNYWYISPQQTGNGPNSEWKALGWANSLENPFSTTIYLLTTMNVNLTANYTYDATCSSVLLTSDPPHENVYKHSSDHRLNLKR